MSNSRITAIAAGLAVLALAGCVSEVETVPAPVGQVMAVFDPSVAGGPPCGQLTTSSSDKLTGYCKLGDTCEDVVGGKCKGAFDGAIYETLNPQIPTPTDLAVNQDTGLLKVPVVDPNAKPGQAYFDNYLNTLDGYPGSATPEVHFSGELDPNTINDKTILVYEFDAENPFKTGLVKDLTFEHKTITHPDGKVTSLVRVWNYAGWNGASRYAIFVLGGKDGVKDKQGKRIIRSALFELATGKNPLCAWDPNRSWDTATGSCSVPAAGEKAKGCCTFNYSALIESSVKSAVRKMAGDKSHEEIELEVKKTVLQKATDFERMRAGYDMLLVAIDPSRIQRDDVVILWTFTTMGINEAVFNPAASPPKVPKPTDLVRDKATGLLDVPTAPDASPAEVEFNAFLNTLDGWPAGSSGELSFTGELDDATVDKGMLVYTVDDPDKPTKLTKLTGTKVSYNAKTGKVTVARPGGFAKGENHVVVAVAGDSMLKNKDTSLATYPRRSALMHLVLSPHPLCENFDGTTCNGEPLVSSFIDDPKGKAGGMTGKEKAAAFEAIRQEYDPVLTLVAAKEPDFEREDVVALWRFTVTSQPEIIYDPTSGEIPFPNDVLLDTTTGKVNISAPAKESDSAKLLREQLNKLDGFTTQGTYFASYSGDIDPASVKEPLAIFALETDSGAQAAMTFEVDEKARLIKATPVVPLKENTRYAIAIVSKRKPGTYESAGGFRDKAGNYVIPANLIALIRSKHPLFDAAKQQSLVSAVDSTSAASLEELRKAMIPLFDALEMLQIKREDVACVWTFMTQSITKPLMQLRALPWETLKASDNDQPKLTGTLDTTLAGYPADAPKTNLGGWVKDGTFQSWMVLNEAGAGSIVDEPKTQGKAVNVPFILTIPKKGNMPAAGWPLVVFQHGIGRGTADAKHLADAFGAEGYATIAFDIPYHGARSWCAKDAHCTSGGKCNLATGQCTTALVDSDSDGVPDASGSDRFINLENPFAIRDNMRQYVVDAAALMRAIVKGGASGITGDLMKFDSSKVHFFGKSLGGIVGHLFLAVDSLPRRGVLHVPGGPAVEIYIGPNNSPNYQSVKDAVLKSKNITEGTAAYVQLVTTFHWIMDSADPGNFAPYVVQQQLDDLLNPGVKLPKKEVIMQLAEKDQNIPVQFGQYLAKVGGFDLTHTLYTGQGHEILYKPDPDLLATTACRTQVVTFIDSGVLCQPGKPLGTYDGTCK